MTAVQKLDEPRSIGCPPTISERWAVAAVALAAAVPSLVSGIVGGGFLTDDWAVWLVFDRLGVLDGLWQLAFEQPARPLAAPYYALLYVVIGDSPVVQSVLIGAVNAFAAVAAWLCGRRLLPPSVLWPALAVFALAPNHAMTRLWFVVGTYPLALALVFLAVRDLDRHRRVRAGVLFVAAILLYEGVAVLGVALIVLWLVADVDRRAPAAIGVAVPAVLATGAAFMLSPKRGGLGPKPFNNADSFFPGLLGAGLWGSPLTVRLAGGALLLGVAVVAIQRLPSWRVARREADLALIGLGLSVAGAAPFLLAGATFATTGLFDRNNLVPSVGIAVFVGGLWAILHARARRLALGVGLAVLAWFAVLQAEDVRNFADAVRRGDAIVEALASSPHVDDSDAIVVVPVQRTGGTGMADFVYDGDLVGALRLRHGGDWSRVRLVESLTCRDLGGPGADVHVFDWTTGRVSRPPHPAIDARCTADAGR